MCNPEIAVICLYIDYFQAIYPIPGSWDARQDLQVPLLLRADIFQKTVDGPLIIAYLHNFQRLM